MFPLRPWLARSLRATRNTGGRRRPASRRSVAAAERLENRELLTAYVVDTLDDVGEADGKVSLREAIQAANTDLAVDEAAAGQGGGVVDSITFDASLSGGTITLGGSQLTVTGLLTITGLGSGNLTIDADGLSRVFSVTSGASLELIGVTIAGGGIDVTGGEFTVDDAVFAGNAAALNGGAILLTGGTATVTRSTFSGNTAGDRGAAIYADSGSTLTVSDSTFAGNTATSFAGGIYGDSSSLTIRRSTFSGNSAGVNTGGVSIVGGTLKIVGSTFSGNSAGTKGGAIRVIDGAATITGSTITGNSAGGGGGGISLSAGSLTLDNTIVVGNLMGGTPDDIGVGAAVTGSHNLIGDAATAGGLTNGTDGNIVGADVAEVLDPVLRDNGGPTLTHALVAGSLAIDAGSNALAVDANGDPLTTDQRGFARVVGGTVDIGAFEWATAPVAKDDDASVDEDGILDGDLFADNGSGADSDPNGDAFTVTAVDGFPSKVGTEVELASGALLTVRSDGTFIYDPNFAFDFLAAGFPATETFTYTISDGDGNTSTATVTITINGVNTGPYVEFDAVRVRNDHIASINVTANDSDPEGGLLTLIAAPGQAALGVWEDLPSGARVKREANGTITLDPYAAYNRLKAGETAIEWVFYRVAEPDGLFSDGILRVVIYGSGTTDLVGYADGDWWATEAGGTKTSQRAKWADVEWDALRLADVDGDGVTDSIGLLDGWWYVGRGVAGGFLTSAPAKWANTDWRDVSVQDVDGDGKADLIGRAAGQWWVALSTSTGDTISFAAATHWATWANAAWDKVFVQDIDGDGLSDLLGMIDGQWWSAISNGSSFGTSELWAVWANVEWDTVGTFDPDHDGLIDVYGLLNGRWYVGQSCGCYFTTVLWDSWVAGDWKDARSGDFDGDGYEDLAARIGGTWYVAYSDPFGPVTRARWATWADVDWQDIRVGDFDGDGREDLIGRIGRQWWLSRSNGTTVSTGRFVDWANLDWQIWAVELTQEVGSSGGGALHAPEPGAPAPLLLPAIGTAEEDALMSFWAETGDDDEFASLLAAA